MPIASRLTRKLIDAGIPVYGVSIRDKNDKSTWRIDFKPEASPQNISDGENIKLAFNLNDPIVIDKELDDLFSNSYNKILKSMAILDFEERQKLVIKPGMTLRTAIECRDRIKEIFKSL